MSSGASRSADGVEHAAPRGAHERRALDELVAREREQPALGRARRARGPSGRCAAAPVAIERGEPIEADEVDRADVDAQLERGGGDDDA